MRNFNPCVESMIRREDDHKTWKWRWAGSSMTADITSCSHLVVISISHTNKNAQKPSNLD